MDMKKLFENRVQLDAGGVMSLSASWVTTERASANHSASSRYQFEIPFEGWIGYFDGKNFRNHVEIHPKHGLILEKKFK